MVARAFVAYTRSGQAMRSSAFCKICREGLEPPSRHEIDADDADKIGVRGCACGGQGRATCVLGPDDFVFRCPNGHLFGNSPVRKRRPWFTVPPGRP